MTKIRLSKVKFICDRSFFKMTSQSYQRAPSCSFQVSSFKKKKINKTYFFHETFLTQITHFNICSERETIYFGRGEQQQQQQQAASKMLPRDKRRLGIVVIIKVRLGRDNGIRDNDVVGIVTIGIDAFGK